MLDTFPTLVSAARDGDGNLIAPRRPAVTRMFRGHEIYDDTGLRVDMPLGTHVVLRIVEDPNVLAAAWESDGDAELDRWPARQRAIAEHRRAENHRAAAKIRATGPSRTWHVAYSADQARIRLAGLRAHADPGVRYEVTEITDASTCPECQRPLIHADAQWRHHNGNLQCPPRSAPPGSASRRRAHVSGTWAIDIGRGTMICGYCNEQQAWADAVIGRVQLTGYHLLGIEEATGTLVVLAEATIPSQHHQRTFLPHHCLKIPDDVRARYQDPRC
jgi:hypothetical protein